MSRIFREMFCGHFPWKLKDENLRKISPKFHRIFRRSLRKISQELRSGGLRAQIFPGNLDRVSLTPQEFGESSWETDLYPVMLLGGDVLCL